MQYYEPSKGLTGDAVGRAELESLSPHDSAREGSPDGHGDEGPSDAPPADAPPAEGDDNADGPDFEDPWGDGDDPDTSYSDARPVPTTPFGETARERFGLGPTGFRSGVYGGWFYFLGHDTDPDAGAGSGAGRRCSDFTVRVSGRFDVGPGAREWVINVRVEGSDYAGRGMPSVDDVLCQASVRVDPRGHFQVELHCNRNPDDLEQERIDVLVGSEGTHEGFVVNVTVSCA